MNPLIIGLITVSIVAVALVFLIWQTTSKDTPNEHISPPHTIAPAGGEASLVCIAGPNQGQAYPIQKAQVQLGRSTTCDIKIPGELVSRSHATLYYTSKQYVLQDQGSTNGVWVNGQRVAQHTVQPSDQIQIGPSVFVLRLPGHVEATPPPTFISSPPRLPPVALPDEYEYLETLPVGGAATVFKVRSRRDGRIAALKKLHSKDAYIKDKFMAEIEVGKTLNHPHIVTVYGGGEHNGIPYMVMEFLEYGSLRDVMQSGGLPVDFSVHIIGQICDALNYVQQRGIYHRDIKPENILFASQQLCKLADFGIAKVVQAVTRTQAGMIIGTPAYMSYEQIKGHKLDHRTDIYSLGVVLYEMVTGAPPFAAADPLQVMDMHVKMRPRPPSQIKRDIPPYLEQAILKSLEKDRERRFRNAQEMARALGYAAPIYSHRKPTDLATEAYMDSGETAVAPQAGHTLKLIRFDGAVIHLTAGVTPLSRTQINPGDPDISRDHAQIVYRGGEWWLHDLKSANGTYVNGQRIYEPTVIKPGMEVQLGRTALRVER